MPRRDYNFFAGQRISRIEALSDGVFAIAMTLLVLDIKVPVGEFVSESDLIGAFWPLMPKFLAYLLGFMTLGIFWVGHATQFKFIARTDRHLTWLNIFFLLIISLFPFSTGFLSEHIHFKFAIGVYWLNIFLAGLAIYIHWIYACKANLLNDDAATEEVFKAIQNRVIIAQSLYLVAALLCFINTYLSVAMTIAVQLNYALALFFSSGSGSRDGDEQEEE
jgi:uncharacterized membrane protein